MLMEMKSPHVWTAHDIDTCVINGNFGFVKHCIERKMQPQMLMAKELPECITVQDRNFKCQQLESEIKVGTLARPAAEETNYIANTLSEALDQTFHNSDSCLLFCGGQTIAIAKREFLFYIFDPHSRGKDGFLHHTGTAVLVSFADIHNLTLFVERLFMHHLRLKSSEQFELVPITIAVRSERETLNKANLEAATPSCKNKLCSEESREAHEKSQSTATAIHQHSSDGTQKLTTELCTQAIDSYFADQQRRDQAHKEKLASNKTADVCDVMKRKDYMKKYMKERRETESIRKQENSLAKTRMKNSRSTSEGKQKNREKAAEGMSNLLNTPQGRLKHNQMSADSMKKMLTSEEAKEKHRERSSKGMKKITEYQRW